MINCDYKQQLSIDQLPTEILLQIFINLSNISSIRLTCRRWNDTCLHNYRRLYRSQLLITCITISYSSSTQLYHFETFRKSSSIKKSRLSIHQSQMIIDNYPNLALCFYRFQLYGINFAHMLNASLTHHFVDFCCNQFINCLSFVPKSLRFQHVDMSSVGCSLERLFNMCRQSIIVIQLNNIIGMQSQTINDSYLISLPLLVSLQITNIQFTSNNRQLLAITDRTIQQLSDSMRSIKLDSCQITSIGICNLIDRRLLCENENINNKLLPKSITIIIRKCDRIGVIEFEREAIKRIIHLCKSNNIDLIPINRLVQRRQYQIRNIEQNRSITIEIQNADDEH